MGEENIWGREDLIQKKTFGEETFGGGKHLGD